MISNKISQISALAVCYWMLAIAQALPGGYSGQSGHPGSSGYLETIPMLSDYANIQYPQGEVQDLGETHKFIPEKEIKVIRTIKISQPYPVHVPVKVPYPVPVVKPVPVEITKVVKVPEPVHVDIVKSVQVSAHSGGDGGHAPSAHLDQQPHWSQQIAAGHGESAHFTSEGHGDESGNYASVIARQAAEYQQDFHQDNNNQEQYNHQEQQ